MTIMQHPTAVRQQPTTRTEHPLVTAILTIAAHRTDMGRDWDTLLDSFGPELDAIAGYLERAEDLDCGALDHEVRTAAAAESEAARLRIDATVSAQLVASLIQAGA